MELVEPDELNDLEILLNQYHLDRNDFARSEFDTTDPKTDAILALTGTLTVTQKSTGSQKQYAIGDGSHWVAEFRKDVATGTFH